MNDNEDNQFLAAMWGDTQAYKERSFRIFQENSPDGFLILKPKFDDKGKIIDFLFVFLNASSSQILHVDSKEFIGHCLTELYPESMEIGVFKKIKEVYETKTPLKFEESYVNKVLGEVQWIRVISIPVIDGVAVTFQDVTEQKKIEEALKESQRRYSSLFNNQTNYMAHCRIITDENGKPVDYIVLEVNEAYLRLSGKKREELEGKRVTEIFQKANGYPFDNISTYGKVALEGGELSFENFFEIFQKWFSIYVYSTKQGEFTLMFNDITDRKLSEIKLQETLDELKRSNRELEQFAYVASHDLQEPLRMITSFARLFENKYKNQFDEKADYYIWHIVDGAKRMGTLIHDLLSFSRVTTKAVPFVLTDLNSILKEVQTDLQLIISESKAEVVIDNMPELKVDPVQIKQLFQNLIQNALKFRREKDPFVKVSAELLNNEWTFSVQDNGIGISSEYYDRIFMLFQRLHEKEKYPGTGLGLAICKKIVERHGGRIWLRSEEGKGTTFYFTLPFNR
ncbi:MAG: ATP-binding protein [Bacteroidota bacterium]|nr:ATP-binding protein [Bacteroidota bacterium]MDP4193132.1 ATP-binding protein [Bacteroidota bacterium]